MDENNPHSADSDEKLIHSTIQQEINNQFQTHGIQYAKEEAELIVSYLILIQNNAVSTSMNDFYTNSGSEILSYAHEKVTIQKDLPMDLEQGTLVVDIIDVEKRKIIHRDYSTKRILPGLSSAQRKKRIQEIVRESLNDFFN